MAFLKRWKVIGIKIVNFDELFDVIVKIVTKQLDEVERTSYFKCEFSN
jgi:hypothetical protein